MVATGRVSTVFYHKDRYGLHQLLAYISCLELSTELLDSTLAITTILGIFCHKHEERPRKYIGLNTTESLSAAT